MNYSKVIILLGCLIVVLLTGSSQAVEPKSLERLYEELLVKLIGQNGLKFTSSPMRLNQFKDTILNKAKRGSRTVNACNEYKQYVMGLSNPQPFLKFMKEGCSVSVVRGKKLKVKDFQLIKEAVFSRSNALIREAESLVSGDKVIKEHVNPGLFDNPRYQNAFMGKQYDQNAMMSLIGVGAYKEINLDLDFNSIVEYQVNYKGLDSSIVKKMGMKLVDALFVVDRPHAYLKLAQQDYSKNQQHWAKLGKMEFANIDFDRWDVVKEIPGNKGDSDDDEDILMAADDDQFYGDHLQMIYMEIQHIYQCTTNCLNKIDSFSSKAHKYVEGALCGCDCAKNSMSFKAIAQTCTPSKDNSKVIELSTNTENVLGYRVL